MFHHLRLRLTLLYFLFAIVLVTISGWGSYRLLSYYFMSSTDLALRYRMARELTSLRVDVPASLKQAAADWLANHARLPSGTSLSPSGLPAGEADTGPNELLDDAAEASLSEQSMQQALYDDSYLGDQAAIFVMPVDDAGGLIFNPNPVAPPMSTDRQAVQSALQNGIDLRTVTLANGSKARLLTYHIPQGGFPFIQIGRMVTDQMEVLNGYLMGMMAFGGLAVILLGLGAWWLAGRSIAPTQRAWEAQRTFVANASHELRTPLTLIRASVEVAQREAQNPDSRDLLGDVLEECDSLNKLVEDLFILSRLDNQRLAVNLKRVDLGSLLPEISAQLKPLILQKGLNFQLSPVSGVVLADPARIKQVLLILLDNAFRYTPASGHVELSAHPNGKCVEIMVTDTGIGIAPEHLKHVYERFYKVDNSSGPEYRGSGLGLSIAKSLVEAQSGSIRLESKTGQGTRAIVSLPPVPHNLPHE